MSNYFMTDFSIRINALRSQWLVKIFVSKWFFNTEERRKNHEIYYQL
jgi:hypothetical protein